MKRIAITLIALIVISGCQKITKPESNQYQLQKLKDKTELVEYLESIKKLHDLRYDERKKRYGDSMHADGERIAVTGSRITAADLTSITNNQVQGVDEGDIVKTYENHLIILRNGKLYSIDIGVDAGDFLQPIDSIDAFHQGWVHDVWLDEMLIDDGLIIITGFNYDEDATEIIRLNIDDQGQFKYMDTHLIKSEDYYSESNYSSRLINHQLVTYFPGELLYNKDYEFEFPKITQFPNDFNGNYEGLNWRDLIEIENIYHPTQTLLEPYLHTFLKCSTSEPELQCQAVGLISSEKVERYITPQYIYLSTSAWNSSVLSNIDYSVNDSINDDGQSQFLEGYGDNRISGKSQFMDYFEGKLFRINIDHFIVDETDIDVVPINQFSFHQFEDDLFLLGENDDLELVKVPSRYFDSQSQTSAINVMTTDKQNSQQFKNRFINDHLVLVHSEIDETETSLIETINLNNVRKHQTTLDYIVDRIEIVGGNAFTSGYNSSTDDGDYEGMYVSLLNPKYASVLSENYLDGIVEGESRSHAFNSRQIGDDRIIGLTSKPAISEQYGNDYYYDEPSEITFVGGKPHTLNLFGHVKRQASEEESTCEISCDDWYGNTRPFFIGNRIFALSGFELIEVKLADQQVIELDRVEYNKY